MKNDGYAAAGAFFGVLAGAFIEIRYVRFTAEGTLAQKMIRVLCGRRTACPYLDARPQQADLFPDRYSRGSCYPLHCFDPLYRRRLSRSVHSCPQAQKHRTGRRKRMIM